MIAIVDYGVGNLFSLKSSLNFLGLDSVITGEAEAIAAADRIILPGVGAFPDAVKKLLSGGLGKAVVKEAEQGKPLLGICLGMQLLFEKSMEYGEHEGLGLIKGGIRPLSDVLPAGFKIPHMGWNSIRFTRADDMFKYNGAGDYFYFVHSFYAGISADTSAYTEYGVPVTAAVRRGNIMGAQFHPEKSGNAGLNILRAFAQTGGR